MKVFVSFRDACWNPRSSQSSRTEGTLLSGREGFDDDIMRKQALGKRAGLFEHIDKDERSKGRKAERRKYEGCANSRKAGSAKTYDAAGKQLLQVV